MNSKIYVGTVNHTRISPEYHAFSYPIYTYAFDLAELPNLDKTHILFGYNRLRPVSLYSKDFFEPTAAPLLDKATSFIARYAPKVEAIARIELVTAARYFNYVFKPGQFLLLLQSQPGPDLYFSLCKQYLL